MLDSSASRRRTTLGAVAQYLVHTHEIEPRDAVSTGYRRTKAWAQNEETAPVLESACFQTPQVRRR